ncbi:hypothetical protein [Nocardia sp. NPDC051570]|uniref:WXG100-like domain-containing protein n=1 Tax=Nocardia sp. NPDC051570 TaxID=3364324 RepID=UPI0037A534A1
MSLYLPEGLRWLGWIAGSSWPDGDEDAMWAISSAWKSASAELNALLSEIDTAKSDTRQAYPQGQAADAMGKLFDGLRSGDQSLESLAKLLEQISDSSFDMGTQLQATKITIIISLCWLAAEIAWAWLFPPTAPAVEAAAVSTTRSFLRAFEDIVQKAIQNLARKLGASAEKRYLWKTLAGGRFVLPTAKGWGVYAIKFGESAVTSAGMNAAVQLGQMADGKRRHFDGNEFGLSILASAAGTLPSREFARYLGNGIDKWAGRSLNNVWGRTGRGAFIGAASGVVGSTFGNLAVGAATGDWSSFSSPAGWVGGMARGGLVGGARGAFAKSSPISESDVRYPIWMHKPGAPRTPRSDAGTVGGASVGGGSTRSGGSSFEMQSLPGGGSRGGSGGGGSLNSRPASIASDGSHGGGSRAGTGGGGSQVSRPGSVVSGGGSRTGSGGGGSQISRPASAVSAESQGGGGSRAGSEGGGSQISRPASAVNTGPQGGGGSRAGSEGGGLQGGGSRAGSEGGGSQNSRPASMSSEGSGGGQSGGGRSAHSDGEVSDLIGMYGGSTSSSRSSMHSDGQVSDLIGMYGGSGSAPSSMHGGEPGNSRPVSMSSDGSHAVPPGSGRSSVHSDGEVSDLIGMYGGSTPSSVHGPGGSGGGGQPSVHGSEGSVGGGSSVGGRAATPTSWGSSVDGGWRPSGGPTTPIGGTPAPSVGGSPAPSVGGTPAPSVGGTPVGGTPVGGTPAPSVGGTPVSGTPVGGTPAPSVGGTPAPSVTGSTHAGGSTNTPGTQLNPSARPEDPFLGPGKDMKGKTRPKLKPQWGPLPGPFEAPDAPDASAWVLEQPDDPVDKDDPDGGKSGASVDVPFSL